MTSSPPMRTRLRNAIGSTFQTNIADVPTIGSTSISSMTPTRLRSTTGARYRPAMNPMTTLGSAAMISTVGLIRARIDGCTNCEV